LIVVKAFVKRGDFKVSVGKVGGLERNENLSSEVIEKIFMDKSQQRPLVPVSQNHHRQSVGDSAVERWDPDGNMIMKEFKPEVIEVLMNFFYRRPLDAKVNVVEFLDNGEQYDLPCFPL